MFGAKPVPSIKLATNLPMLRRLEEELEINCGEILDSTCTLPKMGQRIVDAMQAASGERFDSERLGATLNSYPARSAS